MPTIDHDLAFAPATKLRDLIASKQITSVELTELYLSRIDRLDGQLNSYLTLTPDIALAQAKRADEATAMDESLGPLHGVPISIKDLEMTRGVRTTSGSLVFEDRTPDEDSVVVERVLNAGAVMLGKTNTPEFGHRGTTENLLGPPCRNPWNTDCTPGGSSGGAAAGLVAGLCAISTGSDGGGSIRIPASFCGLYGIKPTQGRVPRYAGRGAQAIVNQLSQPGPITRTVRDAATLLQTLAGWDSRDVNSLREQPSDFAAALERSVAGLRIAWSDDYGYAPVDPDVVDVCLGAAREFERMGCTVDDPGFALDSPQEHFRVIFPPTPTPHLGICWTEARRSDRLFPGVHGVRRHPDGCRLRQGAGRVRRGQSEVRRSRPGGSEFERYDLLLSPTMAVPAFPIGEHPEVIGGRTVDDPSFAYLPFTYPINAIGHPAASLPCGFSANGLPIGLHIVGRKGDEETVLAASAAFEQARPWAHLRPPVS